MKLLSLMIFTALLLSLGTPLAAAQEAEEPWGEVIAPGIEYREYQLPDPNNVFVARMERNNPQVTIESSIAQGRLSGGTETVSGMSQRYDGAINYWGQTWGNTNKVAVAINGYYFNYGTGIPYQGQIHSGWYSKLFDPCETGTGGSGFAWKIDREVFIGESVRTPTTEVYYLLEGGNYIQAFDGINVARQDNQLILYTPQYGRDTGTSTGGNSFEVLVRMTSPTLLNHDETLMPRGIIEKFFPGKGSTPIPFDHVVLSFHGTKKDEFQNLIQPLFPDGQAVEIGIRQRIRGCSGAPDYPWENTYASIGGAFYFLKDGVINAFADKGEATARAPRTAIAYNADYVFFVVVDGRDDWSSRGMSIAELAQFVKTELGATHGIAEDGGGSSTMVVNGKVMNNTYCNIVICKGRVFLPLVTKSGVKFQSGLFAPDSEELPVIPSDGAGEIEQLSGDGLPLTEEYYTFAPDATGDVLQRLVANGMMMVVVQPKELSNPGNPIFTVGNPIKTLFRVNVRLGPGTNYDVLETVDPGITGIILGDDNGLNGVWAKGYYWWRVLLEIGTRDVIGWMIEPALTLNNNFQ